MLYDFKKITIYKSDIFTFITTFPHMELYQHDIENWCTLIKIHT